MSDRSSMKAAQTGGRGTFPIIQRNICSNESAASRRCRLLPFLLGRLETLRRENSDLPLQEIDLFIRAQPLDERKVAFDELIQAVSGYPHLVEIVQNYYRSYGIK